MINPVVIEALRSGKYEQTKGAFWRDKKTGSAASSSVAGPKALSYCALGVIYSLYREGLSPSVFEEFRRWLTGNPSPEFDLTRTLMRWNDKEGLTFPEIADRLEKEYS